MVRPILVFISSIIISACDSGPSLEERLAHAQTLVPSHPQLNEIYQRSCRSCHTLEATGAPLTGDVHAWSLRYEKGESVLVDNVINGYGGMPPFGLCMDCTPEQFNQLIQFMAQR